MKARLLTDGRYGFMKNVTLPLEVEGEVSEMGNLAVTPEQLAVAGVKNVPGKFCCHVWYFSIPEEAEIIEED